MVKCDNETINRTTITVLLQLYTKKYWDGPMEKNKETAAASVAAIEKTIWREDGQKYLYEAKRVRLLADCYHYCMHANGLCKEKIQKIRDYYGSGWVTFRSHSEFFFF